MSEIATEYQYSKALGGVVQEFMNHDDPLYPNETGDNWYTTNALRDAAFAVRMVKQTDKKLTGMPLLKKVFRELRGNREYNGRTSQVLLALLDVDNTDSEKFMDPSSPLYTGLAGEVWEKDNRRAVNPTFREDQDELPVNLQIRKIVTAAINDDINFHSKEALATKDLSPNAPVNWNKLHNQQKAWYTQLSHRMLAKTAIQPSQTALM